MQVQPSRSECASEGENVDSYYAGFLLKTSHHPRQYTKLQLADLGQSVVAVFGLLTHSARIPKLEKEELPVGYVKEQEQKQFPEAGWDHYFTKDT